MIVRIVITYYQAQNEWCTHYIFWKIFKPLVDNFQFDLQCLNKSFIILKMSPRKLWVNTWIKIGVIVDEDKQQQKKKKSKVIINVPEYALNDVIIVDTIAIICSKINDTQCKNKLISQL